jgi:hypothetical protein
MPAETVPSGPAGRRTPRDVLLPAAPQNRVALLRIAVYIFTICDTFWVVNDVQPHADGSQLYYHPLLIRQWAHSPVPNHDYALTLHVVIVVGCLLLATGRLPRVPGVLVGLVVAAAFTDWVSIGMSYNKVDHDHFALIVALWVLPTVGVARFRDRSRTEQAGWALLCIQIGCVAVYFLSSLAKIRFGGWDWPTGATFTWAMTRRGTGLGRLLLDPPWILIAGQFGVMAIELLTPLLLVFRGRYRYAFVLLLGVFHLSTYLTLKIHFLPLVICLLAFLPLEQILARLPGAARLATPVDPPPEPSPATRSDPHRTPTA